MDCPLHWARDVMDVWSVSWYHNILARQLVFYSPVWLCCLVSLLLLKSNKSSLDFLWHWLYHPAQASHHPSGLVTEALSRLHHLCQDLILTSISPQSRPSSGFSEAGPMIAKAQVTGIIIFSTHSTLWHTLNSQSIDDSTIESCK